MTPQSSTGDIEDEAVNETLTASEADDVPLTVELEVETKMKSQSHLESNLWVK